MSEADDEDDERDKERKRRRVEKVRRAIVGKKNVLFVLWRIFGEEE